jgi:hypothetical protein
VLAQNDSLTILPSFLQQFNFADQSSTINFGDWISLLTLCFAPLLAHVIAGAPRPVYLSHQRPSFHDRVCIYNPTSILWRYFAIADRRIRHKDWNAADMAASNTYFWTTTGWDGSEEIMCRSRTVCTRLPPRHRAALLSSESLKTLIISLQGVQALYVLVGGILAINGIGHNVFSQTIAVDTIFFPLAVFGLLRLFAAPWLTDDYSYADHLESVDAQLAQRSDEATCAKVIPDTQTQTLMTMGLLDSSCRSPREVLRPQSSWGAIALRFLYLLPLSILLAICIFYVIPRHGQSSSVFTPATLLLVLFYISFLSASIQIFSTYFILGKATTTVIPCISATSYKIYTYFLLLLAVVLVVVSAVSTRRTACGKYTTFPSAGDQEICNGASIHANTTEGLFGMVGYPQFDATNSTINSTIQENAMAILYLDGWCSGKLRDNAVLVAPVT